MYYVIAGLLLLAVALIYLISNRKLLAARHKIRQLEKEKEKARREMIQLQKDKIDLLNVIDMDKPDRKRSF